MRMKTMTLLAVSGLMAASLAYVIPAFAEDIGDIDGEAPMQLAMGEDAGSAANDNNAGNTASTPADGTAAGTDSSSNGADSSNSSSNPGPSSSNATSADQQGTPDVASGDDDY